MTKELLAKTIKILEQNIEDAAANPETGSLALASLEGSLQAYKAMYSYLETGLFIETEETK